MNPFVGIAIVLTALISLLLLCRLLMKREVLGAELARKMVHAGMGVITACFPLMFVESWPVYALSGLAVASLFLIRLIPKLRNDIGSSLHGVERFSLGEIYFPLAIALIWYLGNHQPILYSLSVLVLAFADAGAALIGTRFGKRHYTTLEGHKSWEGSLAFFVISFALVFPVVWLLIGVALINSFFIAILVVLLVMLMEAVSWRGLDNLFIPLGCYLLLDVYQDMDLNKMLFRLFLICAMVGLGLLFRKRTALDDSALMGAGFATYLAFVLGSWHWSVAPLLLFIVSVFVPKVREEDGRDPIVHNVNVLLAILGPGLIWLVYYYNKTHNDMFYLYNIAYAFEYFCIMGGCFLHAVSDQKIYKSYLKIILYTIPYLVALVAIQYAYYYDFMYVEMVPLVLGGGLIYLLILFVCRCDMYSPRRWFLQGLMATGLSAVVLWI